MFAKMYETDLGQILVKQDDREDGAEVRVYFKPENLGVCNLAFNWKDDDSETQWKKADSVFEKMTKDLAYGIVKTALDSMPAI